MNKKTQVLLILSVFLVFFIVGTLIYNNWGKDYDQNDKNAESNQSELSDTSIIPATSESAEKNTAPDFTVLNKEGKKVSLSDYFGKPIIINFWATWCGPCQDELPHFEKMYKEYGNEVVFLMVNLTDGTNDTVASVKEFISDEGYTFPVYFDTEYNGANTYGVRSIPVTYAIDSSGNIVYRYPGMLNENTLKSMIESIE